MESVPLEWVPLGRGSWAPLAWAPLAWAPLAWAPNPGAGSRGDELPSEREVPLEGG